MPRLIKFRNADGQLKFVNINYIVAMVEDKNDSTLVHCLLSDGSTTNHRFPSEADKHKFFAHLEGYLI